MNKAGTQTIETPRLILRRFRIEDAQDMYDNWAGDPEVTRFLTWPAHESAEISRRVLESWTAEYPNGAYFQWAIVPKETGKPIGSIAVVNLNENTQAADLGYCIGRAYWGRGITAEALKAVTDYLFDVVGLNRVAAYHDAANPNSGRVMEKAGMKTEGILRAAGKNNLGICDEVWHSVIRSDREEPEQLDIRLEDTEWPFEYTDHDRNIVRAIVLDADGSFCFVRADRDDEFGKSFLIETSGGGIEPGEDPVSAIRRELREELGAEVEILCRIGVVSDYYNLIHRHNLNQYFLCRAVSFGEKNLTQDEISSFHLSTLRMTYEQAIREYDRCRDSGLGRLIANRELPVLMKAKRILQSGKFALHSPEPNGESFGAQDGGVMK